MALMPFRLKADKTGPPHSLEVLGLPSPQGYEVSPAHLLDFPQAVTACNNSAPVS